MNIIVANKYEECAPEEAVTRIVADPWADHGKKTEVARYEMYKVKMDDRMETDVQTVYIVSLQVTDDKITVTDERKRTHTVPRKSS